MFKMSFGTSLLVALVSPLLLECTTTSRMGHPNDYVEGQCPVKLTSVPLMDTSGIPSGRATVYVWVKAEDFCKSPKIEILPEPLRPTKKKKKYDNERCPGQRKVICDRQDAPHGNISFSMWDCVEAKIRGSVFVSYKTKTRSCNISYTVIDFPDFDLSVNQSSKSITVTVQPGHRVRVRLCYKRRFCMDGSDPITIDPSQSQSAVLPFSYLLPCVCVQVYYTYRDAKRHEKCPFQNKGLLDVRDFWRSAEITPFHASLRWRSKCSANTMNISASLCWWQHEHLCTPVLSSRLERQDKPTLEFNISAVDKHPQMCVQFSLQGSHNISCPFKADTPSWEVYVGSGRQNILVYLTSSAPAKLSAQLCVLTERECAPIGQVHSVTTEGNAIETEIHVPYHSPAEKLCVQVWQSHPALLGRRILCPDYIHYRRGLYAAAALIIIVVIASLGLFIHRVTRIGAAGWLYIQKPLLLVCSSDESAHVSSVCALASILQGELGATVHTALWAQSSQRKDGTGDAVPDLGPLPWLYGQWEAVCKAQGKVLIIWSAEAKKAYEQWRERRANVDKNVVENEEDCRKANVKHDKIEDLRLNGRRLGKCRKGKAAGKKDCVRLCDDEDWCPQKESSTVIEPVFMAALACLEGALQECKGQGVAIVYFQGLGHSRDIPKALRGARRYCLPQDFRGLIQHLGGMRRRTKTDQFRWHCWPRLLSKVLSIWTARQLSRRLQTLLPQTQGHKVRGQSAPSSVKMTSVKTLDRLKLLPAASPGTAQELELLHGSPWRAEKH
ncbi:uncharacterized protein [Embiotoca jacksoni]|uniref:uncharacterized protein n=1 Tax=Embiotoca jacksoni TaxID=100190 RepID=UPI0037041383